MVIIFTFLLNALANSRFFYLQNDIGYLNDAEPINVLNEMFIAFIPKVENLTSMTDFRLISLYNAVYKFLCKVLVNKIKLISNHITGEQQSTFVNNHVISGNIIITSEVFHWLSLGKHSHCNDAYIILLKLI